MEIASQSRDRLDVPTSKYRRTARVKRGGSHLLWETINAMKTTKVGWTAMSTQ